MTTASILRLAPTLDALLTLLRSGDGLSERDMTSLPTYGGAEPASTSGVWSWDATRLLVGTCADDFRIVDRPRCREDGCGRVTGVAGSADGLCVPHYRQACRDRERGRVRPLRPIRTAPAAGRIGVRLSAAALRALGDRPAERAREVLEAWAKVRR